ncbi:MAG: DUF4159 domain-containing protein [Planctomycetales bacterium]
MNRAIRLLLVGLCAAAALVGRPLAAQDAPQPITADEVLRAIQRGRDHLLGQQRRDGSWDASIGRYPVGTSALVTLALLNTGMTPRDPEVARALESLRKRANDAETVYEVSLLCSAFAAARDGETDRVRLGLLVRKLEGSQIRRGDGKGAWGYDATKPDVWYDRSNAQFALLGLRDAAVAGVPVSREVWELSRDHWRRSQSGDGGWGYSGVARGGSTGSMTVAGISSLTIIKAMLRDDEREIGPDGQPVCCGDAAPDPHLARGIKWIEQNFSVGSNPRDTNWPLYYLYGLERAGRLSGKRFFGEHDWYREGATFLVRRARNMANGTWEEQGDRLVGTSFSLLFLSKGLSPVLISKLQYPTANDPGSNHWDPQPDDVRNLTEHITALPKWPHLMSTQTVDLSKLPIAGGADVLLQSKILYISGTAAPVVTDAQVKVLREYLDAGGYIVAAATCQDRAAEFDRGFRRLVARMFEGEQADLQLLPATHVVYRSEYALERGDETVGLWGVDFGCRTPILYVPPQAPLDFACLWNKWSYQDPPARDARLKAMVSKSMSVGVNIVAYATGREPPVKLQDPRPERGAGADPIERGLLQVARVRHGGGWDTAPRALTNLLRALNEAAGLSASTKPKAVAFADADLYKYPVVTMHGRNSFQLSAEEREQLKKYAERGGVLFADACCGARPFDESFRAEIEAAFGAKLERIPPEHELFSEKVGYALRTVKRRSAAAANPDEPIDTTVRQVEPFLEGIRIDGRYAVIYSKYDISCALEHQASSGCPGYESDDAFRIAINVILYAMLQDVGVEG